MWFVLMVLCCAVILYWQFFLAVFGPLLAVKLTADGLSWYFARRDEKRAAEKVRLQGLIDRATKQHRQIEQGKISGVYGAYPPPKECKGMGIWLAE